MNTAEFLQESHRVLGALIGDHGPEALERFALTLGRDGRPACREVINLDGRPAAAAGLMLIAEAEPAVALFAFDAVNCSEAGPGAAAALPFDYLIAGTYYEADADPFVRPFVVEYAARPFRLGWYEFAPAADLDAAERASVEAQITVQCEVTREVLAVLRAQREAAGAGA